MWFGRLILILMAMLLVQQAQCLAACAVETCQQSLPPCHRHHGEHSDPGQDHATLCLHHAAAPNLSLLAMSAAPVAVASFQSSSPSSLATRRIAPIIAASPPGPAVLTLRI